MKKLLMLAVFAAVGSVSAYATNYTVTQVCSVFATGGAAGSGGSNCTQFGILDGGNTIVSAAMVYLGDYSTGLTGTVTESTAWTFTASSGTLTTINDTVLTTGGSGSVQYQSTLFGVCTAAQMNANPVGCSNASNLNSVPATLAGYEVLLSGYTNATVVNAAYNNQLLSGATLADSGTAELVLTYSIADTSAPEPTTFILMGAGLGLLGMLRRKTARR